MAVADPDPLQPGDGAVQTRGRHRRGAALQARQEPGPLAPGARERQRQIWCQQQRQQQEGEAQVEVRDSAASTLLPAPALPGHHQQEPGQLEEPGAGEDSEALHLRVAGAHLQAGRLHGLHQLWGAESRASALGYVIRLTSLLWRTYYLYGIYYAWKSQNHGWNRLITLRAFGMKERNLQIPTQKRRSYSQANDCSLSHLKIFPIKIASLRLGLLRTVW